MHASFISQFKKMDVGQEEQVQWVHCVVATGDDINHVSKSVSCFSIWYGFTLLMGDGLFLADKIDSPSRLTVVSKLPHFLFPNLGNSTSVDLESENVCLYD